MESSKIIKKTSKWFIHLSKSLNFFEDCQNVVIFLKMKNKSFFLSNKPYSTFRRQKMTKVEGFKAHTAKNNGFFRIFNRLCSQCVRNKKKIEFYAPNPQMTFGNEFYK